MREATIRVPVAEFEALGLDGFVPLCREAGLVDLAEPACRSDGCLLVVTVEEPLDGAVLSGLDPVEWWERLPGSAGTAVYLCKVDVPGPDDGVRPVREFGLSSDEIRVEDGGVEVRLVGTQDDISRSVEAYDDAGMRVALQRMADYDGPETALDALTDRQRETLRTAYECGYFDVPRRASTADVADELGVDPSTVAEHLQRAERNLLGDVFGPP